MKMGTVIAVTLILWGLGLVTGTFSSRMFVALLFLLLMGAVYPPVAVGFGVVAIIYILLMHGQKLTAWVSAKLGGKKNA